MLGSLILYFKGMRLMMFQLSGFYCNYPDPREDPKSRSLHGGSYKVPLVVEGPKLGDLLSRSPRGSG